MILKKKIFRRRRRPEKCYAYVMLEMENKELRKRIRALKNESGIAVRVVNMFVDEDMRPIAYDWLRRKGLV